MKEKKMSRISKFRLIRVRCKNCGHQFFPHGMVPIIPGALGKYTCPYCGKKQTIIHDMELQREFARKELGLDKTLEKRVEQLELELMSLKNRVEDNDKDMDKLIKEVNSKIQRLRKEVVDLIAKSIIRDKTKQKPPSKIYDR